MTKLNDILYARERLALEHPYAEAFRFIRDKILLGATNEEIMDDFRVLHCTIPEVYSVSRGCGLTFEVLERFRSGIELDSVFTVTMEGESTSQKPYTAQFVTVKKTTDAHSTVPSASTPAPLQKSKKDILPAFRLVRQRLSEGWSYDQIIDEFVQLEASGHKEYRSKQGRPITKAILSHWAKELGYDVRPGGKAKDNLDKWKDTSEGYQWFKAQVLAGVAPEAIIEEFNKRHVTNPQSYSTPLGAGMTVSTYNRWRKEIVTAHDDVGASKPISLTGTPSTKTPVTISSSPTTTTMDDFYRQRGMFRVLEWARLQGWWNAWKKNFKSSSEVPVNEFLDGLKSPANLIASAFHWSLTEEGSNYWAEAEESLKKHIKSDVRAILYAIGRQVTRDTPYTLTKDQFFILTGYGQDIYNNDISLDSLCDEMGLKVSTEAQKNSFKFSLSPIRP